jgi:hypothetical protein
MDFEDAGVKVRDKTELDHSCNTNPIECVLDHSQFQNSLVVEITLKKAPFEQDLERFDTCRFTQLTCCQK